MKVKHGGDWAGYQTEYGKLALDFSANVSPLGLPDGVHRAAVRALDAAERYPDPDCRTLREKISAFHRVPEENIVCSNGAADLIDRICRTLRPRCAVLDIPEFGEYARALEAEGCRIRTVRRREEENFLLDTEAMIAEADDAEIMFLSNPNNPTGLLTSRENLQMILDRCREKHLMLVLDECFLELTDHPEAFSMISYLSEVPELVILRAFTKTYAMAGLRLGYALCGSRETASALQDCGQPWPVSHIAQEAGIAALNEENYVNQLRRMISKERPRLKDALSQLGLRVIPGTANYLLFQSMDGTLHDKLRRQGILIRDCGGEDGLSAGWYRVAVRTEEENDRLIQVMREVL